MVGWVVVMVVAIVVVRCCPYCVCFDLFIDAILVVFYFVVVVCGSPRVVLH